MRRMEDDFDDFEQFEAEAEELKQQKRPSKKEVKRMPPPEFTYENEVEEDPMPKRLPPPQKKASQPLPPQQNMAMQPRQKVPQPQQTQDEAGPWVAFHQPEVIGIVNTQTGERIDSFKDEGSAQSAASIKNDLNRIIISGGFD